MIFKDTWLTKQMLKCVYQLKEKNISKKYFLESWKSFKKNHIDENYFVYSKINTSSVNTWQCLEIADFKLVDTNIRFELNTSPNIELREKSNVKIVFAKKKHENAITDIARNNFLFSRFHLDPLIDNQIANQIKQNWVKNYFYDKRGDQMVLALLNNQPVGFLQLIVNESGFIIDLIGVDKIAQGKGIASSMILFAIKNLKRSCMKVGTQIGNIPSIKLYQKLGFILTGSDYVFHYHNK
jgi:GNAT superfamily N-acetyltransferase